MATRFDRRLEKLQDKHGEPLFKVHICRNPASYASDSPSPVTTERCALGDECDCLKARNAYMAATRGRGSFIHIDYEDGKF